MEYGAKVITQRMRVGWVAWVESPTLVDGFVCWGLSERYAIARAKRSWRKLLAWGCS